MPSESQRLEREVEDARSQLRATIEEIRPRATMSAVIDQLVDYTRTGPVGEFLRDLGREVRGNPLPLVLIGIGTAWLLIAANPSSRAFVADATDKAAKRARELGAAARDVGAATGEAGTRLAERAKAAAARLNERAEEVTAFAAAAVGQAEWPLSDVEPQRSSDKRSASD